MSLHQRVSANSGRRASVSYSAHSAPFVISDHEQRLLDSLNAAHTELNKTNSERDRYLSLLEQANKKLAEATATITDLKAQNQTLNQTFKESVASLQEKQDHVKEENDRLIFENGALSREFADLKVKFSNLTRQYNSLSGTAPVFPSSAANDLAGAVPERPKLSRSSSKKERKEDRDRDREERSRVRDKEKSRDREKEDKREREKDKDKEKDKEKEKKEHKAEKERLSRRFEERRAAPPPAPAPAPPPPPIANRRNSFIEGWGPGGRSSSASGSSTRSYTNGPNGPNGLHSPLSPLGPHGLNGHNGHNGHIGHVQVPVVTPGNKLPYANVPRTATNPMTPRIYSVAGSTAAVFDDDGSYEDGNYHAYPISR
ncbi:hypothetical protein TrVFT333_009811 [Trichoderma virens FT-333]|nr:hypothetical protein TrVFT333_009811 [Trichoderma virens FT-333]